MPAPHGALIKVAIEAAKQIDPAIDVSENHWPGDGLGRVRGKGLRPSGGESIPEPRITQIVMAVVAAEENHLMGVTVISHLGIGAPGRGDWRTDSPPGSSVERPSIVQIAAP